MTTMSEIREIKTTSLPSLDNNEIWGTRNLGVFVVVSQRPAQWQGENRDIYGHIDTWYTIRLANERERTLWNQAVEATNRKREQRKLLNAEGYIFSEVANALYPTPTATRKLDCYDDRWEPPSISLQSAQVEIERNYIVARAGLKR